MIIAIDASRANNEQKTGVEWYAYFLIQEMKRSAKIKEKIKSGEVKKIILYSREPLKGDLADLPEGWETKVLEWPPKRLWTQLRLSIEMLRHPVDLLFVPAHVPPFICPKKLVVTIHDIAAWRFPKSYNAFERWYSLWTTRKILKHQHTVIVPSEFCKKEIELYTKAKQHHISVIAHGVDPRYAQHDKSNNISDKYGISKAYLLSVGRLEYKKNTLRIIKAFDKLKQEYSNDYQLVLVGKPGHGYAAVKQAIENSSHSADIIIPGWVEQEDLPSLFRKASLFVFPSLYEGFGMPLLEAFACDTPVLAGKGSSLQEVGQDAVVYADPESLDSIYTGITQVLSDKALANQLREKGKTRLAAFSWKKTAHKTIDVLFEQ